MKEKLQAFMKKPQMAHIMRMNARYNNRLGNQFAGAVTYFSVLAMVPILMFAFSMLGMTLTVIRPDWMDAVKGAIDGQLAGAPGDTKDKVVALIDGFLKDWRGVGIVGILSALYAGAGWISNLKSAVRAQWTVDFETEERKSNIVLETLKNMGILIIFLLLGGVTFVLAQAATSLTGVLVDVLHLQGVPGIGLVMRLVPILVSLLAGWGLFLFLFRVLPEERVSRKAWMRGALIGAIGLVLLQFVAGLLMGSFSKNPAAALFGPVIVIMLFFNLFARVILYAAAWIATSNQPAVARKWNDADERLRNSKEANVAEGHWEMADEDRQRQEKEKAEAEEQRAETINKVKEVVPGLSPDDEADSSKSDDDDDSELPGSGTPSGKAMDAPAPGQGKGFARASDEASGNDAAKRDDQRSGGSTQWSKEAQRIVDGREREFAGGVENRRQLDRTAPVPPKVAVQNARASLGFGYATGIATGAGVGALLAGGLRFLLGR